MCFPNILVKNKWISEFLRKNHQELKCWSIFYVNYFLRYYLMMQHQPIVKRVNGTHEWAHRPYQPLSAPYHCCLYKHRRLDERQPPHTSWPVPACTWPYISQVNSFMQLGMLCTLSVCKDDMQITGCRYKAVQCSMILHTTSQWLRQNLSQRLTHKDTLNRVLMGE